MHIKDLKNRYQRPQREQMVSYSLSKDKQGRICAADVAYNGEQPAGLKRRSRQIVAFIFVALFFTVLGVLTFIVQVLPHFIIAVYAIASAITFITYASDKSAARKGGWRVAEATLQSMSLFGGWPGALLAQQTLRHKTSKAAFQGFYKLTVFVNVAVTAWLLTPRGPEFTMAFLEKLEKMMK